jgi:segregation and condensation protein B
MTNVSSELSDQADADQAVEAALDDATSEQAEAPVEAQAEGVAAARPVDEQAVEPVAVDRSLPPELLRRIVEGALLAAGKPLAVEDLAALFDDDERPPLSAIRDALVAIAGQSTDRGFELREVASGYRFQVVQDVAPWIARLWEEKPQKYSRALLETLALIAYRQPITRGDIEDIRGVAVATNIGHKDVPGRPAMYATTRRFLDYFNLKNLDELPPLADLRDLDALSAQLSIEGADTMLPEQLEAMAGDIPVEAAADRDAAVDEDANADEGMTAGGPATSDPDTAVDHDTTAAIAGDEEPVAGDAHFDTVIQADEATSTEAAADAEPLEPRPDANQSED